MGKKILAAHQGLRTALTLCRLDTLQQTKMNWAQFLAPIPSSSFPSLGPELTRPGPQTGT